MGDVRAALAAMACFAAFARGLRFARAGRPSTGGRTGDLQRRCESEPRARRLITGQEGDGHRR